MSITIHNTLTRQRSPFQPINPPHVQLFVCGPTVYDSAHLGHARTYVAFDAIVRHLRLSGYDVHYLQNITDIDDKIIARANESGMDPAELARREEALYMEDMDALGVDTVSEYARATEHIDRILQQIETLLSKGHAYTTPVGNVYFDISTFPAYGRLSGLTQEQVLEMGAREEAVADKRNPVDFALWKAQKPGEPSWDSPWGPGRPGWHIEDTAITETHFGPQYDMHGGAIELMHPHHEAEIAQMECASGKAPLVRYWVHTGLLLVNGQKMAKSKKNFVTVKQMLERYSSLVFRLFILSTHYRSPVDFTWAALDEAQSKWTTLQNFVEELGGLAGDQGETGEAVVKVLHRTRESFLTAMDDDFNTPGAIAQLFSLRHDLNLLMRQQQVSPAGAAAALDLLRDLNQRLMVIDFARLDAAGQLPPEVEELVKQREQARAQRDYDTADAIRSQLHGMGYEVRDSADGVICKPIT